MKTGQESPVTRKISFLDPKAVDTPPSQPCACSGLNHEKLDPRQPLASSQRLGKNCELFFDQACDLCQAICVAGSLRRSQGDHEVHIAAVYTSVLIRCRSSAATDWWFPREAEATEGYLIPPDDTTSYVVLVPTRQNERPGRLPETTYSGFISPVQGYSLGSRWYARAVGRRVNVDLIKTWLTFCSENHASQCFGDSEMSSLHL